MNIQIPKSKEKYDFLIEMQNFLSKHKMSGVERIYFAEGSESESDKDRIITEGMLRKIGCEKWVEIFLTENGYLKKELYNGGIGYFKYEITDYGLHFLKDYKRIYGKIEFFARDYPASFALVIGLLGGISALLGRKISEILF